MSRFALVIVAAVIVILALTFLLPGGKVNVFKKEQAGEFNVTIFHTRYEPNSISVNHGELVRLNVVTAKGTASYMHGITIDEYGISKLVTSETIPEAIEFVAEKKGTFQIYCGTCDQGPFGREHPDIRLTLTVN